MEQSYRQGITLYVITASYTTKYVATKNKKIAFKSDIKMGVLVQI